ncbi:MAG: hypothetical protein V4543_10690 [Bacteroidota bacterium]
MLNYFVFCTFFMGLAAFVTVQILKIRPGKPGRRDDNNNGGWDADSGLPVINMPPGSTLDQWLTDKLNNRDVPRKKRKQVPD